MGKIEQILTKEFIDTYSDQLPISNTHALILPLIWIYNKIAPPFINKFVANLDGCATVIELGSGKNSPFRFFNECIYSVGVELFRPYIYLSREKKIHTDYVYGDIRKIEFTSKCIDAVICISVFEHLNRDDGFAIIEKMENWARKKVLIYVPNGKWPQCAYDNNELQKHQSEWYADDFISRGYTIIPVGGIKQIAELMNSNKFTKHRGVFYSIFYKLLRDLGQIFVNNNPDRAVDLLCIKEF